MDNELVFIDAGIRPGRCHHGRLRCEGIAGASQIHPAGAVTDLAFILDQDQVTLNWSIPTGKATGTAGLGGFIVYGQHLLWPIRFVMDARLLFRRIAEVDFEELMAGNPDRKTATFSANHRKRLPIHF